MKPKKTKRKVYKWICTVSHHKLANGDKYAKEFVQQINRKKKIRYGVCEFHAKIDAEMMKRRFRNL